MRPTFHRTSSPPHMLNSGFHTNSISFAECNSGTTHKPPFAINTVVSIRHITATTGNTAHPLLETYPARCHYCRMRKSTFRLSSIVVLIPRGQFVCCATVAFSERHVHTVAKATPRNDEPPVLHNRGRLYCLRWHARTHTTVSMNDPLGSCAHARTRARAHAHTRLNE
jgi:hypothetical protein